LYLGIGSKSGGSLKLKYEILNKPIVRETAEQKEMKKENLEKAIKQQYN